MQVYNKLVRDRIPETIEKSEKDFEASTLTTKEFQVELKKKLQEEVNEYLEATTDQESVTELADILEVIHSLAGLHGEGYDEVEEVRRQKAEERGAFSNRIFLKSVED